MELDNVQLTEELTRQPVLEQSMRWLVEHGPVVTAPPLPYWALNSLVRAGRIARLKRDVYLAPRPNGHMPSLPAVATMLAPDGYLSFYGALTLHGLTDQDTSRFVMVTPKRQRRARYGDRFIEFYFSPRLLRTARTITVDHDGMPARPATPGQALIDSLDVRQLGGSVRELFNILKVGLASNRISVEELIEIVETRESAAVARRLGFLLDLVGVGTSAELKRLSSRIHERTSLNPHQPDRAEDAAWRLVLPATREEIVRSAREL